MSNLYVVGDQHGNMTSLCRTLQKTKLQKNDYLVVLGDFGFIWNGSWDKNLIKINRMTEGKIFVVLGNHENYDIIHTLPIEYNQELENIVYHLPDSNVYIAATCGVYQICGHSCFIVNGADSTDKAFRTENRDWWRDECLSYTQMCDAIEEAQKVKSVDYIFSHCTGETVKNIMWKGYEYGYSMEKFMDEIYSILECKDAYFGHYHDEKDFGKFHCLYHNFVKIGAKDEEN